MKPLLISLLIVGASVHPVSADMKSRFEEQEQRRMELVDRCWDHFHNAQYKPVWPKHTGAFDDATYRIYLDKPGQRLYVPRVFKNECSYDAYSYNNRPVGKIFITKNHNAGWLREFENQIEVVGDSVFVYSRIVTPYKGEYIKGLFAVRNSVNAFN